MLKFIFRNTTGSFFRTIGRIIAYIVLGFLISILFSKNVNAAALPTITSGMNYFIYNTDETSPTQNGTKAFSTLNSTVVYPFTSYTNNYFAFGYSGVQFVTSSLGSTNAIGYTITATYKILFDGIQNNIGNVNFNGYVKFQQGSVISEASNIEVIALTSGGATFKVTTTAQLSTTTSLSTILFDLHTKSGSFGFSYYGDVFTVQLSLLSLDVQYATSVDSAILSSLNERQKETNKKLDEVKEETKKHTEEQKKTNDKLDEAQETRKGIWETIKGIPGKLLDMLKGLFIPDDFDFINDFKEVLEDKLGFIAEVPLAVIDFILGLATASWEEFNSITLPSIEMFGVHFWNSQEISLQEAIDIFSPYKFVTDVICVCLCVNTLKRWHDHFANGGTN